MNRAEWHKMRRAIRSDAALFRDQHAGHPCFTRYFLHRGVEWAFTRYRLRGEWRTIIYIFSIARRPWGLGVAAALNAAAAYRQRSGRSAYRVHDRAAARVMVEQAREIRRQAS